jgi:hypothetical protein
MSDIQITVVDDTPDIQLLVTPEAEREVITALTPGATGPAGGTGPQGPQGPEGPVGPGGSDQNYIHTQNLADTVWVVNHTLTKAYPSVTVVDSGGTTVIGAIEYISATQLEITFTVPFTGKAILN